MDLATKFTVFKKFGCADFCVEDIITVLEEFGQPVRLDDIVGYFATKLAYPLVERQVKTAIKCGLFTGRITKENDTFSITPVDPKNDAKENGKGRGHRKSKDGNGDGTNQSCDEICQVNFDNQIAFQLVEFDTTTGKFKEQDKKDVRVKKENSAAVTMEPQGGNGKANGKINPRKRNSQKRGRSKSKDTTAVAGACAPKANANTIARAKKRKRSETPSRSGGGRCTPRKKPKMSRNC